ncbi:2-phosphosulfolactate phosphatase [Thalassoglobus polymorphus]|uniref:Probable 2-phosphosulfolactate phosphatase n=1 Tax=Thalassoglobus polymorphus TaxID=2527994 RepID=A0A517QU12_9PLAN|nr:2-phosphosulfolactate phosphatase [Thalassoglobus polymorphus]QDT35134.1 putative 2-phosphosulfolactate phosphatase [Thalassoglobus polymorphus]
MQVLREHILLNCLRDVLESQHVSIQFRENTGCMIPIQVSLLPSLSTLVDSGQITENNSGDVMPVAVMIDILRASTTIVHALANGASAILPCSSVEQAHELAHEPASSQNAPKRLLGGERHCQKIEGFDLDNSPFSYTPELVQDREIIFTTTNGTIALEHCRSASMILVGAFVNLSSLIDALVECGRPVHLMCAGTDRQLTAEDILFAGAVCDRLLSRPASEFEIADVQSQLALDFYRTRGLKRPDFEKTMLESLGAANLLRLGLEADVQRAMQVDLFKLVPVWNPATNRIAALP